MTTEIRVPTLGESVTEATIAQWFKQEGDSIAADEPVVELETDKVTLEIPAPAAGVLAEIVVADGETVEVGTLLGSITEGGGAAAAAAPAATKAEPAPEPKPEPEPAPAPPATEMPPAPSAAKMIAENDLKAERPLL